MSTFNPPDSKHVSPASFYKVDTPLLRVAGPAEVHRGPDPGPGLDGLESCTQGAAMTRPSGCLEARHTEWSNTAMSVDNGAGQSSAQRSVRAAGKENGGCDVYEGTKGTVGRRQAAPGRVLRAAPTDRQGGHPVARPCSAQRRAELSPFGVGTEKRGGRHVPCATARSVCPAIPASMKSKNWNARELGKEYRVIFFLMIAKPVLSLCAVNAASDF